MLRKALPFILGSIALSIAATWVASMIRLQAEHGTFDRFMKRPEVEPTTEEPQV